jgi:ADP-dependent phosphofructokinase/glucokinase
MTKILKQLQNNKSMGHMGVINEMVKYSRGTKMENIITDLIQTIICTGINPNRMNIGRVIPIIKNNQLSNEMLSNIRPITISDTMSNILEKYLLEKINVDSKYNKFQFGFTSKSSSELVKAPELVQKTG